MKLCTLRRFSLFSAKSPLLFSPPRGFAFQISDHAQTNTFTAASPAASERGGALTGGLKERVAHAAWAKASWKINALKARGPGFGETGGASRRAEEVGVTTMFVRSTARVCVRATQIGPGSGNTFARSVIMSCTAIRTRPLWISTAMPLPTSTPTIPGRSPSEQLGLSGDGRILAMPRTRGKFILAYAERHYLTYPVHDNQGRPGGRGGHVASQSLTEATWLIDIAAGRGLRSGTR